MQIFDMAVKISVKEHKFDGTTREVLKINDSNLQQEFVEQPSMYAWFAAVTEVAESEVEKKKLGVDMLRAQLNEEKRRNLTATGAKVTEGMVESEVEKDKRLLLMREELIEAKKDAGILKAIVKAFEQRKDMLIQLGGMKKQEMFLQDFGVDLNKLRGKRE